MKDYNLLNSRIEVQTSIKHKQFEQFVENGFSIRLQDKSDNVLLFPEHEKTSPVGDFISKLKKLLFLKNMYINEVEVDVLEYSYCQHIKYSSRKDLENFLDILEIMIKRKMHWILKYVDYYDANDKKISREEFIKLALNE